MQKTQTLIVKDFGLIKQYGDGTSKKVLFNLTEKQMSKYHVDRDTEYMYKMWGTTSLITDYWCSPHQTNDDAEEFTDEEMMQKDNSEESS